MEGAGIHKFDLEDWNGNRHQYLVTEHPAEEGMAILYELLGLGAPTLLGLAGAALKITDVATLLSAFRPAAEGEEARQDPGTAGELARFLDALDLPSVGREITRALALGNAPKLTRKILGKARRDGQPLWEDGAFNLAYQANYLEMLTAVWRICQINRFFPQLSTSGDSLATMALGTSPPPVA